MVIRFITLLLLSASLLAQAAPCPEELRRLGQHLNFAAFTKTEKAQLRRSIGVYSAVLAEAEDVELRQGLSALLQVPAAEAKQLLLAFASFDPLWRVAITHRLRWLVESNRPAALREFFRLIPQMETAYSPRSANRLTNRADLQPWVAAAHTNLTTSSDSLIRHILGEIAADPADLSPRSTGGGHTLAAWERVAEQRLAAWPEAEQERLRSVVESMDFSGPGRDQQREFYRSLGFDVSREAYAKHLLMEQHLWGIEEKPNGVLCFWLPRPMFSTRAWQNTFLSAQHGTSPIGGKTIFPASWSLPRIKNAVLAVLQDPQAMVLRSATKHDKPSFYLRGTVDGVLIDVGITGNRVGTAFPSWRQGYPTTIAQAYLSWWSDYDRVRASGEHLNRLKIIGTDIEQRTQMLAVYLGKRPEGVSESDYQTLRLYLDPALLPDSPDPILARSFQGVVFDWLRHEQLLRDLENDPGPYR